MMHEVEVSIKALDAARKRAATYPPNMKNSITKGAGILTGCIGEELFHEVVGRKKANLIHCYDYDYELKKSKKTVEVKTKTTSVVPKLHYECTVSGHNTKQECDYYVFCRVQRDLIKGWVLGYLPKDEFMEMAVHYRKGDKDPSNNFVFKSDAFSVRIDQLKDIKELV